MQPKKHPNAQRKPAGHELTEVSDGRVYERRGLDRLSRLVEPMCTVTFFKKSPRQPLSHHNSARIGCQQGALERHPPREIKLIPNPARTTAGNVPNCRRRCLPGETFYMRSSGSLIADYSLAESRALLAVFSVRATESYPPRLLATLSRRHK